MTVWRSENSHSSVWHFRRVLPLILGCLLVNGALFAMIYRHWKSQEIFATMGSEEDFFILHEREIDMSREERSAAWILIEDTRAAIKAAGGMPSTSLSEPERKAWDAAHPCAGRHYLLRLWNREKKFPCVTNGAYTSEPHILLYALFEEYSNLHRTCTHGGDMEYVKQMYRAGNESSPCKFVVVEFGSYGVGNRLLWLVSAFQYALLTKRVLLIDTRSTVHRLLCEPFPGSSWQLPATFPYSSEQMWPMPAKFQEEWDAWENKGMIDSHGVQQKAMDERNGEQERLRDMLMLEIERERRDLASMASTLAKMQAEVERDRVDREMARKIVGTERRLTEVLSANVPPHFYQVQANDGWAPNPRFFCDNEQERLHQVKWISLNSGCLYFLPDLFAVPSFRPALEELFPYRDPLTHLLQHLTLPVDSIWKEVRRLYTAEFQKASKVVGMQVRYRDGGAMYKTLNDLVNTRITRCAHDNDLLPQNSIDGPVVIFVASLYPGLREHLQRIYKEPMRRRGNLTVKLLQLSSFGFQSFDQDADNQAFMEIICLSLSDEIMTSPQSTYGQMAQAYGALTPWLINFNPDGSSDCLRGQSTDGCYQFPIAKFTCPFNKDVDGKEMVDVAPYLKPCQDSDGLQLVPPWNSSQRP